MVSVLTVTTLSVCTFGVGSSLAADFRSGNFIGVSIVANPDSNGNVKVIANSRSNDGNLLDKVTVRAYLYVDSALSKTSSTITGSNTQQVGAGTPTVNKNVGIITGRGYHTFSDAGY